MLAVMLLEIQFTVYLNFPNPQNTSYTFIKHPTKALSSV